MTEFDTSVQPLKNWLRNRQKQAKRDAIDALGKRILEDTRIPANGSKGLYMAHIRAIGYSAEDTATFNQAWQEMSEQA